MIEVPHPAGRALLRRLLAWHPEWEAGLEPGDPDRAPRWIGPRLRIPSAHPTLATPLTIELGGTLQLFWHGGYFYDFIGIGGDPAAEAFAFLRRFFAEEVRCGLRWRDGKVVAGGPVEDDETILVSEGDHYEIRSWRGTRDEPGPESPFLAI